MYSEEGNVEMCFKSHLLFSLKFLDTDDYLVLCFSNWFIIVSYIQFSTKQ